MGIIFELFQIAMIINMTTNDINITYNAWESKKVLLCEV